MGVLLGQTKVVQKSSISLVSYNLFMIIFIQLIYLVNI